MKNTTTSFIYSVAFMSLIHTASARMTADGESTAPLSSSDATSQKGDTLGEIIVTAQKREQSINDVGLAITAISGGTLKERQIDSLEDIANIVPGLSYSNSAQNTPIYTLRGVGFSESSLGAYPDVAVYLDEVSLPFPVLTTLTAFDLERIEVLKGPQGTLFGNNATGGAINYVAAKPTDTFAAGTYVSYGRFNTVTGEAYVSGPLAEGVQARLSGKVTRGDDWQHGYTTNETVGKTREYAVRLLLDWEPTSNLRFALNLNGWQDKSDPQALQFELYRSNVAGVNAAPIVVNYPRAPDDDRAADFSPNYYYRDNRLWQTALRTEWDVTHAIKLTALTSYIDYKRDEGFDQDGLTAQDFDVPRARGNIQSFSQEVRLDNGSKSWFRWVVGANYTHDHVFDNFDLTYDQSSAHSALNVTTGGAQSDQTMNNRAAFANGELNITPQVTLKAGGRYTEADRHYDGCTFDVAGGYTREVFNAIASAVSGTVVPIPPPNSCDTIRADFRSQGNFVDNLNENNFSWRVGLDYKPTDRILLFSNVAKGYKAGSFPTAAASTTVQFLPVKQESVLDYEAGFKLTLWDRLLQFNGTGFYYDYRNKQLRAKLLDPVFGLLDNLQNVPKSSVKGGELELTVHPFTGASIALAATYLDARVDEFSGYNAAGVFANFAGTRVPFTPELQLSVNPRYEFGVTQDLTAFVATNVNFRSSTSAVVGGSPLQVGGKDVYGIDKYTLVDAQLGIRSRDHNWEAQIWGKNIFNEYYWTNVLAAYDTISRYSGRPATFGVSLSYSFH
jgi:iron complex outermembrane recepter protein